jgi:hypothetical protein
MTRTAYDEFYGVGIDTAISANYVLRLTYGENGANFYCLRPSAAVDVRLPIGTLGRKGDKITVANHGTQTITVKDVLGTTIATVVTGTKQLFVLLDNATLQGTWLTRNLTSAIGTTLVYDRVSLRIAFGTWAGTGVNLRDYANTKFGYDGSKPASIYCELSGSIVIGSEISSQPAFDSGTWPAGTTLLLWIGAGSQVVGIGGKGGAGGEAGIIFASPGLVGGDAIVTRVDTAIVNYGTISGGGGGGGGGSHASPSASGGGGGGGGGGAGYQPALGGAGGSGGGTQPNGSPGLSGAIGLGGLGGAGGTGAGSGGAGGGPGAAGSNGTGSGGVGVGGLGGATGNAIVRILPATVNKIVAGTINGPEVAF